MANLYICSEVEKLVKRYGTRDPYKLIKKAGAILKYSDKYLYLKGYYFHSLKSHFIVINASLPSEERRIVAAHELAHYILHRDLARDVPIRDSAMFTVKLRHEYEANIFCAELLLPDEDILEIARETEDDFFAMSCRLRVMPELLIFKLQSMNNRGYRYSLPFSLDSAFLK